MAKPKFPLLVSRGAATVTIYRTPARVRAARGKAKAREYDAYTLVYTFAGQRRRKKFHDLGEARAAAERAATDIANGELGRRHLTETESSEYLRCREALGALKVSLGDAIAEYAAAKRGLPDVHLVQAVQFFKRYRGDQLASILVPDAVKSFLSYKEDQRVGPYHLNDLKTRLERFTETFRGDVAEMTTAEINAWLKALKVEPRTQNNYRAAVVQLFNYARGILKALPHWLPHAAQESIRVNEPAVDTEIYTPAEMRTILAKVKPRLAVLIAIRAFSGIRNEELFGLEWDEIDLQRDVIKLKRAVTKLGQRRVMPLLPNLKTWLGRVSPKEGPVALGYVSAKTMSEAIADGIRSAGVVAKRNALRNSYTSYRLAILGEVGKVAEETGNSPQIIKEEYLELTTPDLALEWFRIIPGCPIT